MNSRHRLCGALCCIAFISCNAFAQQESGTVVVFQLVDNKFIVAADSRGLVKGIPHDTDCKISTFRHKVIFANSGNGASVPDSKDIAAGWTPWDTTQEARTAVSLTNFRKQKTAEALVNTIADAWGARMKHIWEVDYSRHPDVVKQAAASGQGGLTNGIFAAAMNGTIAAVGRAITLQDGVVNVSPKNVESCTKLPCAMGLVDVVTQYVKGNSLLGLSPTEKVIKLVDLTSIHEQPNGTGVAPVGGPTDALELWKGGSIHWIQRKRNCPKNQD